MDANRSLIEKIRPYQLEMIKIFKIFDAICRKYDLEYFADGGTALGAVRHRGMIPWDDDFDVVMPREALVKFVSIADKELPAHLVFKRGGEDGESPIYFCKIVSVEKDLLARMNRDSGLKFEHAPFIDVFALDGVPDDIRELNKLYIMRMKWRLVQLYRYPKSGRCTFQSYWHPKFIVARMIGCVMSPFYPKTRNNADMMSLLDRLLMKWAYYDSFCVVEFSFWKRRIKLIYPRYVFGKPKAIPFEDGMINVAENVDEYLHRYFGDYMALPPPEHRIPEHLMKRAYNHI